MIRIKLPKDPLTTSILTEESEKLYIELTNELLKYAKLLTKKSLNNQKMEMILFKLSSSDVGGMTEEFLSNLNIQKNLANTQGYAISKQMNETLTRLLNVLSSIKECDRVETIPIESNPLNKNYTEKELRAIDAFINLRKKSYEVVEYIGAFFVKKQVPKDKLERELFAIAINSLKTFDIDEILKSSDIETKTLLMNTILNLYRNKTIDTKALKEVKESLKDDSYKEIIDRLSNITGLALQTAIK